MGKAKAQAAKELVPVYLEFTVRPELYVMDEFQVPPEVAALPADKIAAWVANNALSFWIKDGKWDVNIELVEVETECAQLVTDE